MNKNDEKFLELAFKTVCDFEKFSCEEILNKVNKQSGYNAIKVLHRQRKKA